MSLKKDGDRSNTSSTWGKYSCSTRSLKSYLSALLSPFYDFKLCFQIMCCLGQKVGHRYFSGIWLACLAWLGLGGPWQTIFEYGRVPVAPRAKLLSWGDSVVAALPSNSIHNQVSRKEGLRNIICPTKIQNMYSPVILHAWGITLDMQWQNVVLHISLKDLIAYISNVFCMFSFMRRVDVIGGLI